MSTTFSRHNGAARSMRDNMASDDDLDSVDAEEHCPICRDRLHSLAAPGTAPNQSDMEVSQPAGPAASSHGPNHSAATLNLSLSGSAATAMSSSATANTPRASSSHDQIPSRLVASKHPAAVFRVSTSTGRNEQRMHRACAGLIGRSPSLLNCAAKDACKRFSWLNLRVCICVLKWPTP